MRCIRLSDMTLKYAAGRENGVGLSFRDKIEIAKLLDRLNVGVIELPYPENLRADSLLIKSVAMSVKNSIIAAPVSKDMGSVEVLWAAVRGAKRPRLQLEVPMSAVQMEYFWHKKPDGMIRVITDYVTKCRELCNDVEVICQDATRGDSQFLYRAINAAVSAGAGLITLCDSAGTMLADEMGQFVRDVIANTDIAGKAKLAVCCADTLSMGGACSAAACISGADEIKVLSCPGTVTPLSAAADILRSRGDSLGLMSDIRMNEVRQITTKIASSFFGHRPETATGIETAADDNEMLLSCHDTKETLINAAQKMGYELNEEDAGKIFDAFMRIAEKKQTVTRKELDSIIAAVAMQVPPTYRLENYVISCGNNVSASAHILLKKEETRLEGVSLGDGPIDAAFHAIEQIVGRHFELDDFSIRAVTEGREAMGETVIRLRSEGRVFSGRGISTDIVDSAIRAYLSALNKIVYEEAEA